MSSEHTSTGVKIIYAVPASAPRILFIPVMRIWFLAGLLIGLVAWSAASAYLLFALFARFDLTIADLLSGKTNAAEAPPPSIPAADAPRVPAAAMVPETDTVPPETNAAEPAGIDQEDAPVSEVVLPDGLVEPLSGAGLALDLMQFKWSGPQAQLSFSVVNVSENILSGRIYARGVFQKADGTAQVQTYPPGLEILQNAVALPDFSTAEGGLFYSTRKRVAKSLVLTSDTVETSMTALDLYFVDEKGAIQATFRFP